MKIDKTGREVFIVPAVTATANPGAGAEVSFTVPAGEVWRIISVSVLPVFATQTPWPALVVDDGTNIYFKSLCGTAVLTAGVSPQCSWFEAATLAGGATDTTRQGTLPGDFVVPGGHKIRTVTAGIGANCDYPAAYIAYEKLPV